MMQRRFSEALGELRGLINLWSAPLCNSGASDGSPTILLAVSGGIDSMCMAELSASVDSPVSFAVAHCNFRLRGKESDGDEALVRKWAADHNARLHVKAFDTEEYASEKGISIEMAARELRYAWFASLCREYGYRAVAVAHNANDNAETLMLNVLRGSGLRGLAGMSVVSPLPVAEADGEGESPVLFRPLLACTRKQIEGYMFSRKAAYREDSTNASSVYKRNRIRNEVFPIFETVNPSFIKTLNREMGYFAEAGEIVDDWCRSAVPAVVKEDGGNLRVDVRALMAGRHWRYLLFHILEPYGFNSSVLASLEELLTSSRTLSGKRFKSQTHILLTGRNELTVIPSSYVAPVDAAMPVRGEGVYDFNGRRFKVEVIARADIGSLKQPEGVLMMDAGRLRFPFFLRRWMSGDWLIPFGMRGKKKVSDLFTDLRYDSLRKADAVIIADAMAEGADESRRVAGIACLRIDNAYRISEGTSSIIRITEIK